MSRKLIGMLVGATFFAMSGAAQAVTISWATGTFTGSNVCCGPTLDPSNFDQGSITFEGFLANSLDDIIGDGEYHSHGGTTTTVTLDLLLDGVWTNVFSDTISDEFGSFDFLLSDISTPIAFSLGTVSGIRLFSAPGVNLTYHNLVSGGTTFEFSVVPLPAALPLFGTGLGIMSYRVAA